MYQLLSQASLLGMDLILWYHGKMCIYYLHILSERSKSSEVKKSVLGHINRLRSHPLLKYLPSPYHVLDIGTGWCHQACT